MSEATLPLPPKASSRLSSWQLLLANRLAAAGHVVVTQGGAVVDVGTARGPVRIRRPD